MEEPGPREVEAGDAEVFASVDPDPEACERCGTFATLSERAGRRLCAECDARRHPIVREPFGAWAIVTGTLSLLRSMGIPAAVALLLIDVPHSLLLVAVPVEAQFTVSAIWGSVFGPIGTGLTVALAHQVVEGERIRVGAAIQLTLRRWPSLFGANLLSGLAIGVGALACLVPGIYLALSLILAAPLVINEGSPAVPALGESYERMKGRRLDALFALVIIWVPVLLMYGTMAIVIGLTVGLTMGDVYSMDPPPLAAALDFVINIVASLIVLPAIVASAVMYEKIPPSLSIRD